MTRRLLLVLVLTLALSGCGTLFDTLGDKKKTVARRDALTPSLAGGQVRIYGGLLWDLEILAEGKAGWMLVIFALDLPISAVLDTLLLPLTVTYNLTK